jgi:hypothetical protein
MDLHPIVTPPGFAQQHLQHHRQLTTGTTSLPEQAPDSDRLKTNESSESSGDLPKDSRSREARGPSGVTARSQGSRAIRPLSAIHLMPCAIFELHFDPSMVVPSPAHAPGPSAMADPASVFRSRAVPDHRPQTRTAPRRLRPRKAVSARLRFDPPAMMDGHEDAGVSLGVTPEQVRPSAARTLQAWEKLYDTAPPAPHQATLDAETSSACSYPTHHNPSTPYGSHGYINMQDTER